jgi:hypothetical protein
MTDFMQGSKDDAVAVPFSDDEKASDAAVDLDEDSPSASPEERITRKQRRQARIQNLLQEGKQSKEELAALRTEQAKTREELAQLRGYIAAQPAQRPANDDGRDPYQKRLDAIYERQNAAYVTAQAEVDAGTFTDDRKKHWERVAREIESDKILTLSEKTAEARAVNQRSEQAQQVWVQKYPEVYNNPKAYQYAKATWERRQALGESATHDMVDEVMNETMATFRLGKKAAPTASERSRVTGIPSAGSGGGSRSPGIVMTPAFTRMAEAAYPDLPQAEAVKKWVDKTGKRLREKKLA